MIFITKNWFISEEKNKVFKRFKFVTSNFSRNSSFHKVSHKKQPKRGLIVLKCDTLFFLNLNLICSSSCLHSEGVLMNMISKTTKKKIVLKVHKKYSSIKGKEKLIHAPVQIVDLFSLLNTLPKHNIRKMFISFKAIIFLNT